MIKNKTDSKKVPTFNCKIKDIYIKSMENLIVMAFYDKLAKTPLQKRHFNLNGNILVWN